MVKGMVFFNGINEACKNVSASFLKVGYESISDICY